MNILLLLLLLIYRESNISADVLLNALNELRKTIKCEPCFENCVFGVKTLVFCHIYTQRFHFITLTKSVNH